jgi:hypothetical protein
MWPRRVHPALVAGLDRIGAVSISTLKLLNKEAAMLGEFVSLVDLLKKDYPWFDEAAACSPM